jgi:branched-chain amino acid transport system permease protein
MSQAFSAIISIGFLGLAFAMVLYLVSVGLSVTMGLMGFANLAHGVLPPPGATS